VTYRARCTARRRSRRKWFAHVFTFAPVWDRGRHDWATRKVEAEKPLPAALRAHLDECYRHMEKAMCIHLFRNEPSRADRPMSG
jgi:hypothetical protein